MADVRIAFYVLFGLLPLGLAIYLFATAKRKMGHWVIGIILLLIAVMCLAASVDIRNAYPH